MSALTDDEINLKIATILEPILPQPRKDGIAWNWSDDIEAHVPRRYCTAPDAILMLLERLIRMGRRPHFFEPDHGIFRVILATRNGKGLDCFSGTLGRTVAEAFLFAQEKGK